MSKQPRLQEPVSHTGATVSTVPRFVFESILTRETELGVAWIGRVRDQGGYVVTLVSNEGDGRPNAYQVVDTDKYFWLKSEAKRAYPDGAERALDGFVADLWIESLGGVFDAGEAAAEMGF